MPTVFWGNLQNVEFYDADINPWALRENAKVFRTVEEAKEEIDHYFTKVMPNYFDTNMVICPIAVVDAHRMLLKDNKV